MKCLYLFFVLAFISTAYRGNNVLHENWRRIDEDSPKRGVVNTTFEKLLLQGQGLVYLNYTSNNLINPFELRLIGGNTTHFTIRIRDLDVCVLPALFTPTCQAMNKLNKVWIPTNLTQPPTSDLILWVSIDKKNRQIRVGTGYANLKNELVLWVDQNSANAGVSQEIGAVDAVAWDLWPYAVLVDKYPLVEDIPPQVLATEFMTLDILSENSAIDSNSLPDSGRELFGAIAGPSIQISPEFAAAVDYSLQTPGATLNNKLREKVTVFGGDPNMVYIRGTIGPDKGKSPGSPFVLEIWPPGKYSPIHDHGSTVAVIKVLHGEITARYFNPLSENTEERPLPFLETVFKEGQVTWITPLNYQTHQLENHRSDTACITIQSYLYQKDDFVHYETFDYLAPNTSDHTLHHFLPGSDFTYEELSILILDEYRSRPTTSCFGRDNLVLTETGKKKIGDLTYNDRIWTPVGFSEILWLKDVPSFQPCLKLGSLIVTPDHLIQNSNHQLERASVRGIDLHLASVRGVLVKGDLFYCEELLVSSHSHYPAMTYLTPLIDRVPRYVISFWDQNISPVLEAIFK